ncbi:hypothetical protein MDA_GLEAN10007159 [Myotis davidii]|uniref:Uncharacterized protein n=1 Tax=Myotis davidii TaxID=225400 RepID=L5MB41_MYODS|nr:hypothetical protein MDA_GLEAN10007159 [Myotis davidii]
MDVSETLLLVDFYMHHDQGGNRACNRGRSRLPPVLASSVVAAQRPALGGWPGLAEGLASFVTGAMKEAKSPAGTIIFVAMGAAILVAG